MTQPYFPGYSDFKAEQADYRAREDHSLRQNIGILNVRAAMAKAAQEQEDRELRRRYAAAIMGANGGAPAVPAPSGGGLGMLNGDGLSPMLAFGEGGMSLPGGAQGNFNTGEVLEAPQMPPPQGILSQGLPQHGGAHPALGILAQLDPKSALPYVMEKPQSYTLNPGGMRYGPGNNVVARAPKIDMINRGNKFEAVDLHAQTPGTEYSIGVSPNTVYSQDQQNIRHRTPSGSTIFAQDAIGGRHREDLDFRRESRDNPPMSRFPGTHRLPDGSTVSNSQLLQMWRAENRLMDEFEIKQLERTNPARAQSERQKINAATPFRQWATENFGVDVSGGFSGQRGGGYSPEVADAFGGVPMQPPMFPGRQPGGLVPPLPGGPFAPQAPRQAPGAGAPIPRAGGQTPGGASSPGERPGQQPRNVEGRKSLNGKNYVKMNGQWFEE